MEASFRSEAWSEDEWPVFERAWVAARAYEPPTILAALRAVEAVRAFPKSPKQIVAETRHEAVAYAFGYRDGVEAVQTLLEGEK